MINNLLSLRGHKGQEVCMTTLMHLITHHTIEGDCWIWKGATDRKGYGQIRIAKKLFYVSRVMAWLTFQFDINNKNLFVCHHCDNPFCINPKHLFIGDAKTNSADMVKKFRQKKRRAKPNERDLIFLSALHSGKTIADAAGIAGYSYSYATTIKSIHLPYWISSGTYSHKQN